jgi:hypothetical protein
MENLKLQKKPADLLRGPGRDSIRQFVRLPSEKRKPLYGMNFRHMVWH